MLDRALAWAAAGWPVFPCNTNGVPALKEWQKQATTDEATIRAWDWDQTEQNPFWAPDAAIVPVWEKYLDETRKRLEPVIANGGSWRPGALELLAYAAWRAGKFETLTVSSSEGLRYLVDLLTPEGLDYLRHTPIFVPHARIAENAKNLDFHNIILTEGADAGLMAGLVAYNWPA